MMNIKMKSGIQKKYLKYTLALLVLALLLSNIGVWGYMHSSLTDAIVEKYKFMDEKMGMSLDNLYQKSDEATAECILYDGVQKSLQKRPLEEVEKNALSKYFAYIDLDHVEEYCYVDNKQNVYTRSYSKISYQDLRRSGLDKFLGDDYSKTQWIFTEDTLFGGEKQALFIGRYVRSMEYPHDPGMLFLKMDGDFFSEIMSGSQHTTEKIVAGVMDAEGQFCALWRPKGTELPEKVVKMLRELSEKEGDGMILDGLRIHEGALMVYRQENSGLIAFTFVPDKILASGMMKILLVLAGIYLLVIAIAVNVSIYFSRRFTRPIQDISEAMSSFDGNDFSRTIDLYTNTELDQIGYSYNQMLGKIERLLREIREQEEELRKSELNMLISQINPHFLYNTLDTIYMLARINKEETTMKMIQALSRYLRLSLNKGSDIVTVENELENVKSYMEIQQIRNKNLFHYEIDCQVKASQTWILKLILQPLVENAIKYGFCNIYEGGVIRITVKKEENCLVLTVYNTGKPMDTQTVKNLNSLVGMSVLQMKESFPDRQHGYGIVNIITRLRLKYGEDIQFCYETDERGTKCIIKVPAKDAERI